MSALADFYTDVFAAVFAFRAADEGSRPSYGSFRSHVMSALGDARRRVDDERLDPDGLAQEAVVALVDETVMSSDWSGAEQWRREPLQLHYYDNRLAGERFFERLDGLRSGADDDLMEVYFFALCAGFEGRFRDEPGELKARIQRLVQQFRPLDLRDEKHLTESAYGRHLERPLGRRRFPFWWMLPFVLGAAGLYAAYHVILTWQVQSIVDLAH